MDSFAAPSLAGSHGTSASLSLSTESDAGAGATPGARIGVAVQGQGASLGSALGGSTRSEPPLGSALAGGQGEQKVRLQTSPAQEKRIAHLEQRLQELDSLLDDPRYQKSQKRHALVTWGATCCLFCQI